MIITRSCQSEANYGGAMETNVAEMNCGDRLCSRNLSDSVQWQKREHRKKDPLNHLGRLRGGFKHRIADQSVFIFTAG